MKTILVPVDFQEASIRSLHYIEDVFQEKPVQLLLLHVIPADDATEIKEIESAFQKFEGEVLKDFSLPYKFEVRKGHLLDEIQNIIHLQKPNFVVIGAIANSLSKAFIKLTDCPVLIIPENNNKTKISNIAYANDFDDVKVASAFAPLLELCLTFDAKVHVVHLNKGEHADKDASEQALEYYLHPVEHDYASIPSDDFVTALENYVHDEDIDVLSVLLRDHGKNATGSKGKFIEELVNKAQVPVVCLI